MRNPPYLSYFMNVYTMHFALNTFTASSGSEHNNRINIYTLVLYVERAWDLVECSVKTEDWASLCHPVP